MVLREIARRRLATQRISSTPFTRPEQVVAWLGAVQAQDYLGALWAIGLRLTGATEGDVERALEERTIVRTWPMRGTLHFVSAIDARWMTELLAPRKVAAGLSRLRSFGIDEAVLKRARRIIVRQLESRRRLTRSAAYTVLEDAGIATTAQRGLHILWWLAQHCVICFGPRERKQQTFVLFDEWLPQAKTLPREEALATLAHRYFTGHGPATLADFAWWSGLTSADARRAILIAGNRINEETANGERYWSASAMPAPATSHAGTHILPAFDEFLVGYTDRSAAVDASLSKRVAAGGILYAAVVVDAMIAGTWKRRIDRHKVVCSVELFKQLNGTTSKAVTQAFQRYARFLGLDERTDGSTLIVNMH